MSKVTKKRNSAAQEVSDVEIKAHLDAERAKAHAANVTLRIKKDPGRKEENWTGTWSKPDVAKANAYIKMLEGTIVRQALANTMLLQEIDRLRDENEGLKKALLDGGDELALAT